MSHSPTHRFSSKCAPVPYPLPLVLDNEVAGIVTAAGAKVRRFKPGDRVMGMVQRGSYMDYVAVKEELLTAIPKSTSFEEAGAGGVGHAAVQLAKQHGAYIIATAREYNHDFIKKLGADELLDYTRIDFSTHITDPVDIVLDSAMDPSTFGTGLPGEIGEKNFSVTKDGGTYISVVAFAIN